MRDTASTNQPNHPRISDVMSGTKITIKQFGSTVGAVVTSVAACSTKCDSKGESLQIINVKGISGAVLQQSYIYSNSSFEIFQRAQPSKSGKEAQKAPIRKDFPEDASGIKPGDCFTNSKFGDDSTILVVTETKQLKSMAKEGAWKDQLVVQLKVRADNPHTTIAEGDLFQLVTKTPYGWKLGSFVIPVPVPMKIAYLSRRPKLEMIPKM